jgi:hypothetical protein
MSLYHVTRSALQKQRDEPIFVELIPKMRKALAVVGGIALIAMLLIGGFIGYSAYEGHGLDASSKEYVDKNIPLIISSWSKDELLKRASPQLLQVLNKKPDQIDRLFQDFAKLGAMRSYDGSKGDSNVSYTNKDGKLVTAAYIADATFANGSAHISVRLIRTYDSWELLMFNVNSPLFAP